MLDPRTLDTDGDRWADNVELGSGVPVEIPDDDRDGQPNWVEDVNSGRDEDGDGISDNDERWMGSYWWNNDSDGDGHGDLDEVLGGGDPIAAWRVPTDTGDAHVDNHGSGTQVQPPTISPAVGPSRPEPTPATETWDEAPYCEAPEPEPTFCEAPAEEAFATPPSQ